MSCQEGYPEGGKARQRFHGFGQEKVEPRCTLQKQTFQKLMTLVFHPETSFEDRVVRIKQTQEFQFVSTVLI